jgi:hypothetical protein
MGTKISNLTRIMILMRQVSGCSSALDVFDDPSCSQGDDNDLGDENLPLLEDRKSWPSKLFDCFEISPLDMKDDFLSVKKIADWDDIKSNKYQVSSEVSTWMVLLHWVSLNHGPFQDDEDHLGDEYDLEPDVAFLEFILGRIQQVKHDNKEPSLFPRSLKTLPDECDDPGSGSSTAIVRMAIISSILLTNSTIRVVLGVTQVMKKLFGPTPFQITFHCKSKN